MRSSSRPDDPSYFPPDEPWLHVLGAFPQPDKNVSAPFVSLNITRCVGLWGDLKYSMY